MSRLLSLIIALLLNAGLFSLNAAEHYKVKQDHSERMFEGEEMRSIARVRETPVYLEA